MAIIECVFEYDENTEKVSQVVHILGLDSHDVKFVTPQQGLALECEEEVALPTVPQIASWHAELGDRAAA